MRSNPAALALSLGMGLLVLLIGFLALSMGGLVTVLPAEAEVAEQLDGPGLTASTVLATAYVPVSAEEAAAIAEGDALFKNNCAQCHAVNDRVVGPALAGISKRHSISWLILWVKNSSKVIASGDEYAVKLFDDNGKQQMPAFPQLSASEIKSIITWVSSRESSGMVDDSSLAAN
jgi:mono/diheme cytochrome c family protein